MATSGPVGCDIDVSQGRFDVSVTLSHPSVSSSHRKVISSHSTVTLSHFKGSFSEEKPVNKILNCIKVMKEKALVNGKLQMVSLKKMSQKARNIRMRTSPNHYSWYFA